MLYFFTDPYEDELMYNVFARYNRYSGNLSTRGTEEELFGRRLGSIKFTALTSHLSYFVKQFINSSKYSSEYFIYNHTIFPLYKAFLPKARIQQLLNDMMEDKAIALHIKIGETSGGICKNFGIRCCIRCMADDIKIYGEAYIHRIHQVPGNQICNKHFEPLRMVIVSEDFTENKLINLSKCTIESRNEIVNDGNFMHFKNLSEDISTIFEDTLGIINHEDLIEKYKLMLMKKGLRSIGGRTNWDGVEKKLLDFYPSDFLSRLECDIEKEKKSRWTKQLINKKILIHPIKHLLFIRVIFGSAKNLLEFNEVQYKPFGAGPWPCLNPVAPHYKKEVVTDLELSKRSSKSGKPLGIFKCECGYVYTRFGPDKNNDDKYKKSSVKSFGDVWMNTLKNNILMQKYNISEIQELMHCDFMTIGKYAKILGVFHLLNSKMKTIPIKQNNIPKYDKSLEKVYKSDIELFIKNNPNSSRKDIDRKLKKQYAWLRRHRKDWLDSILPDPLEKSVDRRKKKSFVNWSDRDEKISVMVQKIIDDIRLKEDNFKITLAFLKRKIKFCVSSNLDKLPKTKNILKINNIIKG